MIFLSSIADCQYRWPDGKSRAREWLVRQPTFSRHAGDLVIGGWWLVVGKNEKHPTSIPQSLTPNPHPAFPIRKNLPLEIGPVLLG
jgi:hypothetical protein